MKEKNYNLELIRLISFILVIVIHVTNYFCRAYGRSPRGNTYSLLPWIRRQESVSHAFS